MPEFPAAMPHGAIDEVFDNVFVVRGRFKINAMVHFDRNMAIVRRGDELVAINSVRLTDDGEAQLAKLGKVKHVVRIGAFHGMDDPYFVDRYGATLWGPKGKALSNADKPLDGDVIHFEKAAHPEAAILLPQDGGTLITCDSYQNWTTTKHCSLLAALSVKMMGFGPAVIGPRWAKKMGPDVRADFDALAKRDFKHLIPGHGTVLRDEAKAKLPAAITKFYG